MQPRTSKPRRIAHGQALLGSIQKNGDARGKVAERGHGLIELFDLLTIHDDGELRSALVDLKKMLGLASNDQPRDTNAIRATLQSSADLADQQTAALTIGRTAFSLIDVD